MITIRANTLVPGHYVWLDDSAQFILSVRVSLKGKFLTNIKHFEPEQKVIILEAEEIASFKRAQSQYNENTLIADKYKRINHVIVDGKISFSFFSDTETEAREKELARQQAALNIKLKYEKALTVGEVIDYLSGFAREDKVKFLDDDGDFHYLDKNFDWLLAVERASKKN